MSVSALSDLLVTKTYMVTKIMLFLAALNPTIKEYATNNIDPFLQSSVTYNR